MVAAGAACRGEGAAGEVDERGTPRDRQEGGGSEVEMSARYTASDIAKWFLCHIDREAGESITHLKLQKLVYYAQAWALALMDRPLFDEEIKAWAHGPVAESVFHEYKRYAWNAIPCPEEDGADIDRDTEQHLEEILNVYGDFSAKHLEQMTHAERPWKGARGRLPPYARSTEVISKKSMADFYGELYRGISDEKGGSP